MPTRGRKKLAARLGRAAEGQARKLEFRLAWDYRHKEDRSADLLALNAPTRILKELSTFEDLAFRADRRFAAEGGAEHEQALAAEGGRCISAGCGKRRVGEGAGRAAAHA